MGENGKENNGKLTVMIVQYPVDDDLWCQMSGQSGVATTVVTSVIMARNYSQTLAFIYR